MTIRLAGVGLALRVTVMLKLLSNKFTRRAGRVLMPRILRRFSRRDDGAAAIEFAMVAAPFLALIFAIIETAIVFFASQVLETAASESSRLVMTGQAQTLSQSQFKTSVCSKVFGLFDCASGIKVDVRTYASFANVNAAKPIDANGNLVDNFVFQPGAAGEIVVVRLMYEWPVYVSLMGLNLSDMSGSKRLIMATAAFRNEPF